MQELANSFIEMLYQRKRPARINLTVYNQKEWFRGVYSTVQRVIPAGTFTVETMARIRKSLFDFINTLQMSQQVHQDIMDFIGNLTVEFAPMTIGQAQKLINMLLKYHTCFFLSERDTIWNDNNAWIQQNWKYFHVPIDSQVLKKLVEIDTELFSHNILLRYNLVTVIDGHETRPWSKIANLPTYEQLQSLIANKSNQLNFYPLEFEMRCLWNND